METQFKRFTVRFFQSKYNVLGFVLFSLISLHAIYSFTHKLSSPFSSEPTSSKSKVSDFRDFQYWNSSGPFGPVIHPPQPSKDGPYHDRLIAEGGGKNNEEGFTVSKERAVIIPSFEGHFKQALTMLRSLQCLCLDINTFNIHVVLSNAREVEAFKHKLQALNASCPTTDGQPHLTTNQTSVSIPSIDVVNMYDILPSSMRHLATENDTSPILSNNRFKYQGIKKLQTTRHFKYQHVLWLDSEGLAVQPFRLNEIFDAHVKEPIVWCSRASRFRSEMVDIMESNARVLGRSHQSFGEHYWNLESLQWIIDRDIVEDLFHWVESAHGKSFWDVFYEQDNPFEIGVYNLHIAARKVETTDPLFAKYKILETEREMIQFGLAPFFQHREELDLGGFLEYAYLMLEDPEAQPKLSAFLNRYKMQLFRIPNEGPGLDIAPKEVMKKFLTETPIAMLISGAPDVHKWWNSS